MGYDTKYKLTIEATTKDFFSYTSKNGGYVDQEEHEESISKIGGYDYSVFDGEGRSAFEVEKTLRKYSKKYPKLLFIIECEGEGHVEGMQYDIWRAYALNGKVQIARAQIVFEKFNKNKLK